jgi:hypothetical protein
MMFSGYPISSQPLSASGREMRVYFDMGLDLGADLTLKIYVTTAAGYATLPTDSPASQPFKGVLKSFSFQRSIMQGDIGQFATGTGTLVISNDDADYDYLPLSYAIDGRPITIRVGRRDGSYADTFRLARLTASGWKIGVDNITINLVDFSYKLEVPMQTNVYGGTGGVDGGADLAGKRKPLCLGYVLNITAVVLVPNLLIHQVHDGAVQAIVVVYIRGIALKLGTDYPNYAALEAASVPLGYFATCLALGLFKLSIPADGIVTADVRGDTLDGYIVRTADMVRWALRHRTDLVDPDDLDTDSFDAVNAAQPAPINYFLGPDDNLTVAAFIENIMGGIGGWGGHKLDGTFEVRIFRAPTGNPLARFNRGDMIGDGDIEREELPAAYNPPRWRWRVIYARNWTVQPDLSGNVTAAHKAFVAEPYRLADATSTTIRTDHPFAQDRDPVPSYFSLKADADAEAARLIALFKTTRAIYRFPVPRRGLRRDIGDEIEVTHPRFDLTQGRNMIVVETGVNVVTSADIDTVEMSAYG